MQNCPSNSQSQGSARKIFIHHFIGKTIVFGLLAFVVWSCNTKSADTSKQGKGRKSGPTAVEIKVIKPEVLENAIQVSGSIVANEKAEIRPEVSGRVIDIRFKEGSLVKKGELLVKMNDSELQAQLKKNLVQEKLLSSDEFRQKKLLEMKAISQEEYDVTLNQLNMIQADQQLLKAQIAKTEIYAPFSGKVGLRTVSPGNYIVSNTLVAVLQQLDPVKIEFSVPEKYSFLVKNNMPVKFQVENMDSTFSGTVYALESGIETETRTMKVRATCPNPSALLLPGTFARVTLVLEKFNEALMVPSQALTTELKGNSVFICKNGKAKTVPVVTGIRTDSQVQVVSGLQSGDSLITTGLLQISNGSPVMVRKGKPEAQKSN